MPPSNKSTASIPGLDHWAFYKWGTTAPTTNSKYQMHFFQADSEIVSNSHLPRFLSFPTPKTPNLLTLWWISQYLSCSVQFDFYLSLIKRIRWTSSERPESHQPQQGQKGARGSTDTDFEWTEQLWGLGKYLQKKKVIFQLLSQPFSSLADRNTNLLLVIELICKNPIITDRCTGKKCSATNTFPTQYGKRKVFKSFS